MTPDVSIVMINHNGSRWLREAVDSCLAQEGIDFELVVTDDASTDDSLQILREVAARDPRLRIVESLENVGISQARNLGIEAARGRYIAIFDSDDRMLPHTVASQHAHFERLKARHPDLVLLCSDAWLINEAGVRWGRYMGREYWDRIETQDAPFWTLPSTWFFEKSTPVRFFPGYRYADALYFTRSMQSIGRIGFIGEPLIEYRLRLSSVSNAKGAQMVREMDAAHASAVNGRLANPLCPEEVPAPGWQRVARWRHGRNAKAYAANGRPIRAAFETALAAIADPRVTFGKVLAIYRQRHLRRRRLGEAQSDRLPAPMRWGLAAGGLAVIAAIEWLRTGVTLSPFLGLVLLFGFALLFPPRQLVTVALAYLGVVCAILLRRAGLAPADPQAMALAIVQSLAFAVGASLAVVAAVFRSRQSDTLHQILQALRDLPTPVLVSDPEGLIVSSNPAAGNRFGRSDTELVGRTYTSLLSIPGDRERSYSELLTRPGEHREWFQLASDPDAGRVEVSLRTIHLGIRPALLTLIHSPAPGGTGEVESGTALDAPAAGDYQRACQSANAGSDSAGNTGSRVT